MRRILVAGLAVGVPLNRVYAGSPGLRRPACPRSSAPFPWGAYAAGFVLLWPHARPLLSWLAPPGRMALTNYLMHSRAGDRHFLRHRFRPGRSPLASRILRHRRRHLSRPDRDIASVAGAVRAGANGTALAPRHHGPRSERGARGSRQAGPGACGTWPGRRLPAGAAAIGGVPASSASRRSRLIGSRLLPAGARLPWRMVIPGRLCGRTIPGRRSSIRPTCGGRSRATTPPSSARSLRPPARRIGAVGMLSETIFTNLSGADMQALNAWLRTLPEGGLPDHPRPVFGPEGRSHRARRALKSTATGARSSGDCPTQPGRAARVGALHDQGDVSECHGLDLLGRQGPRAGNAASQPDRGRRLVPRAVRVPAAHGGCRGAAAGSA